MTKKTITIIMLVSVVILSMVIFINFKSAENKSNEIYSDAIMSYKTDDYSDAYNKFSKISPFSTLKPAALFRQARCASKLYQFDNAIKHYQKIVQNYPNTEIAALSYYNMALIKYDMHKKGAKQNFEAVLKKYPETEIAKLSEYYLGCLYFNAAQLTENDRKRQHYNITAANYFKSFIKKMPADAHSLDAVEKLMRTNPELNQEDNLAVARVYYNIGNYRDAKDFLYSTKLNESWCDLARTFVKLKEYSNARSVIETGLRSYSNSKDVKEIYEMMDMYLSLMPKEKGLKYLMAQVIDCNGFDYLVNQKCQSKKGDAKIACLDGLYKKYPTGRFAPNALSEVFYSKVKAGRYSEAERLGRLHTKNYPYSKSAPFVMYQMAKVESALKKHDMETACYKGVLSKYPDTYYAYRAYLKLNKNSGVDPDIKVKPVVFPYKKTSENNFIITLAELKDYDLVEELCKNDKFVQSWIAYRKGKYTTSIILARDAMEKINEKPPFSDLRWRLVYPVHYYEEIKKHKLDNNPTLLLSIMKEESHFDDQARSCVGALGLMQLMPATAREVSNAYGLSGSLYNPENNIRTASLYFSKIKRILHGKSALAVLAYNGGFNAVSRWKQYLDYEDFDEFLELIPYDETKLYLKKVLRTYWCYTNIY